MSGQELKVPHMWTNCPSKSSLIANTFIACKTMLDERYDAEFPEENRFNWKMLSGSVQLHHNRKIGMVVDLTNSEDLYDKKEVERDGCRHVKIVCKGNEECPAQKKVNEFIHEVLSFINDNPQQIICVHCTHGFNRTGFMIVSYLFNVMNIDLQTSVNMFLSARSPGIYKEDYLNELSMRYGEGIQKFVTPQLPDWCKENDCFEGAEANKLKKTKFMDGMIPNVDNVTDTKLVQEIQSIVNNICGWKDYRFPGSQPVSLDKENIKMLTTKKYRVTWKADGQRYLMLIRGKNEIFMLDRDLAVYRVNNMTFPRRKAPNEHITDTLLDGEMVIDQYPQCKMGRYLVYDIIRFEGQEVCKTIFDTRLKCISLEIVQPRTKQVEKGLLDKREEPFEVYPKSFWDLSQTRKLLDGDFCKNLLHETDGLIFQPLNDVYKFGQCNEVLKWKPPELNTVDFKLIIETSQSNSTVGNLMVDGFKPSFATIEVTPQLRQYNNKIIECSWDIGTKVWKFVRERTDKSHPNMFQTVRSIMNCIKKPVTKEGLYHVIDFQRFDITKSKKPCTIKMNKKLPPGTPQNPTLPRPLSSQKNVQIPPAISNRKTLENTDPFGLGREVDRLLREHKRFRVNEDESTGNYVIPIPQNINTCDPLGLLEDESFHASKKLRMDN